MPLILCCSQNGFCPSKTVKAEITQKELNSTYPNWLNIYTSCYFMSSMQKRRFQMLCWQLTQYCSSQMHLDVLKHIQDNLKKHQASRYNEEGEEEWGRERISRGQEGWKKRKRLRGEGNGKKGKEKTRSATRPFVLQGGCGKEAPGTFSIRVEIVLSMEKEKLPFSLLRLSLQ